MDVVIPAHNEEAVIERCLRALFATAEAGEIRAVVVANACSDSTAELARAFSEDVQVVETDVPSKSNALNLGDDTATRFPRIYLDADVVLTTESARQLARALEESGVLAVAPLPKVDCRHRSWAVRAYYDVWSLLPYCRTGMVGSGVYALSAEGRRRFGRFPAITADDAFVRLHFAPHERKTVDTCSFTIVPPRSLRKIVDIKTRSHFGNVELRRQYPHLWKNEGGGHGRALMRLAVNPCWWPALTVYLYVKVMTRWRVFKRLSRGEIHKWERDDTSRQVEGGAAEV